tara:strand:+ start:5859 stop:7031 length:1173 start_codon:yes stop_codon:yes gene_type:complete
MKKSISILGSTGSIGINTLSIINKKKFFFDVYLLSANKNYKLIYDQIKKYKPKYFIINNNKVFLKIKKKLKSRNTIILESFKKLKIKKKIDITVTAIPGIAGLEPTVTSLKFSKKILIANKESVICGWELIKKEALKNKTEIVPVDSEHFAISKLINNHNMFEIRKIYITASGGPFLNYNLKQLKKIRPKEALKHPKWKMGKKISIDSATLMNKIFELDEAKKLFNIPEKKIDILIHPNSLVHAIVEFKNGLTKFIYHDTSMVIPLANAIFEKNIDINNFFLKKKKKISFENLIFKKVDPKIFPVIKLRKKFDQFPSSSIIINASNEVLVDKFLREKIPFLGIFKIIKTILNDRNYKKYAIRNPRNIKEINKIDLWAKNKTLKLTEKIYE